MGIGIGKISRNIISLSHVVSLKWPQSFSFSPILTLGWPGYLLWLVQCRRRHWQTTPALLPGNSHGWRSLVGCSPWGHESQTWLSDFPFTFHFHALEKEIATHSSVLAWRIPGMGEPGGLPSIGSHRVTCCFWVLNLWPVCLKMCSKFKIYTGFWRFSMKKKWK